VAGKATETFESNLCTTTGNGTLLLDMFDNPGAIHQLLNIILQLRILVLLFVSTLPYVVKAKNYS
jgi:hypothetical protein